MTQLPGRMREGLGITSPLHSHSKDVLMTWRSGWPRDVELEVPASKVTIAAQEDIPSPAKPASSAEISTLQKSSLPSSNHMNNMTSQTLHHGDTPACEDKTSVIGGNPGVNSFLTGLKLPYAQVL
jgi:hypothetical protein